MIGAGAGFDVAAGAVLLVALLLGLSAGIVRLALGVVSIVVGLVAAVALADEAARVAEVWIRAPEAALLAGFVAVLALALVAFSLLSWMVRRAVHRLGLGWADRALGSVAAAGLVLVAASAMSLALTRFLPRAAVVRGSHVIGPLAVLAGDGEQRLPQGWRDAASRIAAVVSRRTDLLPGGAGTAAARSQATTIRSEEKRGRP